MNTAHQSRRFLVAVLTCFTALFLAGCASTPKVDWDARVGNYTFDQAVADYGPPDKQTSLSDGTKVADWVSRKSSRVSFGVGTGFRSGGVGVGVGQSVSPGGGERVMRLTFAPDGKLKRYSKNY